MYNVYAPKGRHGSLGRAIKKQLEIDRKKRNKVWRFTFKKDAWIALIDLNAWKMNDGERVLKNETEANDQMAAYDEEELCERFAVSSGCPIDGTWGAGSWVNVITELVILY
mgnify:CR=1 FL=1